MLNTDEEASVSLFLPNHIYCEAGVHPRMPGALAKKELARRTNLLPPKKTYKPSREGLTGTRRGSNMVAGHLGFARITYVTRVPLVLRNSAVLKTPV